MTAISTIAGAIADNTLGATHYFDDSLRVPPCWARLPVIEAGKISAVVTTREDGIG